MGICIYLYFLAFKLSMLSAGKGSFQTLGGTMSTTYSCGWSPFLAGTISDISALLNTGANPW